MNTNVLILYYLYTSKIQRDRFHEKIFLPCFTIPVSSTESSNSSPAKKNECVIHSSEKPEAHWSPQATPASKSNVICSTAGEATCSPMGLSCLWALQGDLTKQSAGKLMAIAFLQFRRQVQGRGCHVEWPLVHDSILKSPPPPPHINLLLFSEANTKTAASKLTTMCYPIELPPCSPLVVCNTLASVYGRSVVTVRLTCGICWKSM